MTTTLDDRKSNSQNNFVREGEKIYEKSSSVKHLDAVLLVAQELADVINFPKQSWNVATKISIWLIVEHKSGREEMSRM